MGIVGWFGTSFGGVKEEEKKRDNMKLGRGRKM